MTEQQKDVLQHEVLEYLGKTLGSKGTRKDKDGNDVDWKLYKLQFATGGNYPWAVKAFNSLSDKGIQVADLEEGAFYKVVYKITSCNHEKYGLVKSKQAVLIEKSSEAEKTDPLAKKVQPTTTTTSQGMDLSNWEEFVTQYKASMEAAGDKGNPMLMIGVYIANHQKELAAELITKVKEYYA